MMALDSTLEILSMIMVLSALDIIQYSSIFCCCLLKTDVKQLNSLKVSLLKDIFTHHNEISHHFLKELLFRLKNVQLLFALLHSFKHLSSIVPDC